MKVVLISTYDLGHQPFGLASPAAWLRADGHEVFTADLARESPPLEALRSADWIGFHLPMHTATRMAIPHIKSIRELNPAAKICCFGLYAAANREMLREFGVTHVISGEYERALAGIIAGRPATPFVMLDRLPFLTPDRTTLPPLTRYAGLRHAGLSKIVGYTEASRGCKHLCRHCPIVPVYEGRFRIVQREVVMADIRQQVAAGAQHISFGDPDFLNGPAHAMAIAAQLHSEFPGVTWDAIIKVEHLLKCRAALPVLASSGCLFITSAVESLDDGILARLAKGHTRADFIEAVELMRAEGLTMVPTFVAFTPWTTHESYLELLTTLRDMDLIEAVAPVQLTIRLLIPAGSKLLELDDLVTGPFDAAALSYRWEHADPRMDTLARDLLRIVRGAEKGGASRRETFALIWSRAFGTPPDFHLVDRAAIPWMTEPWYC